MLILQHNNALLFLQEEGVVLLARVLVPSLAFRPIMSYIVNESVVLCTSHPLVNGHSALSLCIPKSLKMLKFFYFHLQRYLLLLQ